MNQYVLDKLATELADRKFGGISFVEYEDTYYDYKAGVKAGIIEMLSHFSPVLNAARSQCQRPQKPDKLKREIYLIEHNLGMDYTFPKEVLKSSEE